MEYIKRILRLDTAIATFNVYKGGLQYKLRIKYRGSFNANKEVCNIFSKDPTIEKIELISKTWL